MKRVFVNNSRTQLRRLAYQWLTTAEHIAGEIEGAQQVISDMQNGDSEFDPFTAARMQQRVQDLTPELERALHIGKACQRYGKLFKSVYLDLDTGKARVKKQGRRHNA